MAIIRTFFSFQADEFCTFHGLTVTEGFVNFSRSSFIEPESKLPAKRAWKLIESKRSCSIGEVGSCRSRGCVQSLVFVYVLS